jgi:threonine dehydratase
VNVGVEISAEMIAAAQAAGRDLVRRTPTLTSRGLSERLGGDVVLKAESLQRTGSFKLRGVLAKLASLSDACQGVVTGSAGNHAQSLAYAARARGIECTVFMPASASLSKVASARAAGADVILGGDSVDECIDYARAEAERSGLDFVHPFDDPWVIAGQATLGAEILDQVPDVSRVLIPIGGGGLASGVGIYLKRAQPSIELIGVQAEACAALRHAVESDGSPFRPRPTVADGIAIKHPGKITSALLDDLLDGLVAVTDDQIAEAMMLTLERTKLLLEGAGAVGIAALLAELVAPAASGSTVAVLSGGNIDVGLLGTISRWYETERGRRLRVFTRIDDRPGALGALLTTVGDAGANVIDVAHVRDGVGRHVRETGIEVVVETRGPEHAAEIRAALAQAGFSHIEP